MRNWHCILTTEGADGIQDHELQIEADTKAEAGEIAFVHFMELADEAVMSSHESPTPLILRGTRIYAVGVDLAQGDSMTAYTVTCGACGSPNLQRNGTCHICATCGTTTGCS